MKSVALIVCAALAGITSCLPQPLPSTHDILTSVYGPLDTWDVIRAIDVDPNGTFEGKPINDTLVYAYQSPKSAGPEKRDRVASLFAEKLLKRGSCALCCYDSGNWVPQYQLYSGKDQYCIDADGHFDSNWEHQQYKNLYQATDGNWNQFTNQDGKIISVWFHIKVSATTWNIKVCQEEYENIVTNCRGKNPDSAGGISYSGTGTYGMDPRE